MSLTRPGAPRSGCDGTPGGGPAVRVSPNSGVEPLWAKNGRELYYLEQNRMMAVAVDAVDQSFNFKPATLLFESRYIHGGQPPSYDVSADGRFVMIRAADTAVSSFNIVLNWAAALTALPSH